MDRKLEANNFGGLAEDAWRDYYPVEKWRRKGHEFIELYVAYVVGGHVKTEIRHTAIFSIAARSRA